MPHECTNCGRTFADGSKEMLSGCPDCGGNKFQFDPSGGSDGGGAAADASAEAADPNGGDVPDATPSDDGGATGTVGRARETVRDWVGTDDASSTGTDPTDGATADAGPATDGTAGAADDENAAQADARSGVVAQDELPDDPPEPALDERSPPSDAGEPAAPTGGTIADTPDEERPDLSQLREELNQQFESIKIVQPGRYELNLMELYDRDEYIISLQEDGRYVIEVPETWRSDEEA
ncbi:OapC/ArvC family zinc-ribbon domain-containing protein [Halostella litorea]|uniref:OapC/ArvC family zinc-ribbon domain-containing protein n=1 Tax=Halostella litorea TaxID=2528831 RepID=UPI0010919D75|nr:Zn-ribbon containing protein [Halostella litorea]